MTDEYTGFDNGEWHAVTLGSFICLLIDAGHDPAVCFRVVEDGPHNEETGSFTRRIECILVPDGMVKENAMLCKRIGKTLQALIEGGVVK